MRVTGASVESCEKRFSEGKTIFFHVGFTCLEKGAGAINHAQDCACGLIRLVSRSPRST